MGTKLLGFSCFLVRNIFGSLVVCLTPFAPCVHFPCIGHALHIATSCTHLCYPCHALGYTLFLHPSMSCLSYALQHFILSQVLNFIFSFILHPSCIIIFVRTFISYPYFSLTICLFVTKRERVYSREYTREFCHFYMALMHILRGEILFLVHICRGKDIPYERCIYQGGEDIVLIGKLCFVCVSLCLFSCLLYGALSYVQYLCFIIFIASCLCWTCKHPYAIVLH